MKPSRLIAVEHVCLEVPNGLESQLRWFYGEVCQLQEVHGPSNDGTLLRFRSEGLELRIQSSAAPAIDPVRRRMTIAVLSLNQAAEQLEEFGLSVTRISGFTYTDRRLATFDPAGHRVELKQWWPEAPL